MQDDDRYYLGNVYGYHDGYDGSVFIPDGVAKTVVASVGGVACILEVYKFDKETKTWKKQKDVSQH